MKNAFRYYPVTFQQKQWGLYVTCLGHPQTKPGVEFPSAAHPDEYYFTWKKGRILHEWQLILLEKGKGEVEFKNQQYEAGVGSLIILPPNCWHRYRPDKATGWTTYFIGFSGDLADRLIGNSGLPREGGVLAVDVDGPFARELASTVADLLSTERAIPFSAAARIPLLVARLIESQNAPIDNSHARDPVILAQSYIMEHQAECIDFEKLAESLGLSYRSFRYLFTRETGSSPLKFQLERRLMRAKNLLASSDIPIQDIAATLGFRSTWYFSHFFRKQTTLSPAAYRKRQIRHELAATYDDRIVVDAPELIRGVPESAVEAALKKRQPAKAPKEAAEAMKNRREMFMSV